MTPTRFKLHVDPLGRPRPIVLCGAGSCPEFFGDWDTERRELRVTQAYQPIRPADGTEYARGRSALPKTMRLRDQLAALMPRYVKLDVRCPAIFRCRRCDRHSYLRIPETARRRRL